MRLSKLALYVMTLALFIQELPLKAESCDFQIEVSSEKTLNEIREELRLLLQNSALPRKMLLEIDLNEPEAEQTSALLCWDRDLKHHGEPLASPRVYAEKLTDAERADIREIVTFLANHSILGIIDDTDRLEAIGDRIDHIHPLNFLSYVFSDEELKVGIRNIRGKMFVWKPFIGPIKESLGSEASIGNITEGHIRDFTGKLKLDMKIIYSLVVQRNWDEFIDKLLAIPRKGGHDRAKD